MWSAVLGHSWISRGERYPTRAYPNQPNVSMKNSDGKYWLIIHIKLTLLLVISICIEYYTTILMSLDQQEKR